MTIVEGEKLVQPSEERNDSVWHSWKRDWVRNAAINLPGIERDFSKLGERCSLVSLARINYGAKSILRGWRGPAIVIGSGPSLDDAAPLLRNWKGGLFASGSNAKVPDRFGRKPDYIGVFDANDAVYDQVCGHDWRGVGLLTNPSVSPKVIGLWRKKRWPRYYYTMAHEGMQWFDELLPALYPDVGCSIMNAGCTGNNLVQCAWFMGYSPIFLVGLDFSFTAEHYRCTYYSRPWAVKGYVAHYDSRTKIKHRVEWESRNPFDPWVRIAAPHPPATRSHIYRLPGKEGRFTYEEQIEYKMALFSVWMIDKGHLINTSPDGLIDRDEMPYADIREVIANGGSGYDDLKPSSDEIGRRARAVLARHEDVRPTGDGDGSSEEVRSAGGGDDRATPVEVGGAEAP